MNNIKISVIIPVYNVENYLRQCLDSIINQTLKEIEIICINDGSTDSSKQILEEYALKDERIKIINQKNKGVSAARNTGIDAATGEYIGFVDSDDWVKLDAYEKLYNKITREDVDIVFSRYNYVFEDGRIEHNPNYFKELDEIKINSIDENLELLKISPSIWTKIFKKSFILDNKIRFPEGVLAEDLFFIVQYLLKANGIVYLNNYFSYNYRIRDSGEEKSTIHIRNKKSLMAMIDGYLKTYNILKDQKQEKYFSVFFKEHFQYWMNSFILSNTSSSEKKELLEKVSFLFEKVQEHKLELDMNYLPLFNDIVDKKFDQAILFSDIIADFKKRETRSHDRYLKLQKNYLKLQKNYYKNNQRLEKLLDNRKKQVAELQTVSGWLNYKFKNIFNRLKQRVKS